MRGFVLLAIACLCPSTGAPTAPSRCPDPFTRAVPHPLDGPDLDLRIKIGTSAVTLDATFNLAFLDEVLPMTRADEYALAVHEQPVVRDRVFAWLRLNTVLRIDGVVVPLSLAAFEVDPGDPRLLPMFPIMGSKALIKARFQLEGAAAEPPAEVNVVWRAYPPNLVPTPTAPSAWNDVPAVLLAFGREEKVLLRHDEPEFTWHAPVDGLAFRLLPVPQPPTRAQWSLPLVSMFTLLALGAGSVWQFVARRRTAPAGRARARRRLGAAWVVGAVAAAACWPLLRIDVPSPLAPRVSLPTATAAATIFSALHANVYRAFDCTEPSAVYDALAASVEGSLLDTMYQDVYRSLVMQDQGGAVSRVHAVHPMVTEIEHIGVLADAKTASFTVQASWQVDGVVSHWGHEHWRRNAHRARYTVIETALGWRIAGAEPLQQERLEVDGRLPPRRVDGGGK